MKGERFVMPAGFMKVSANPLKGNTNLTSHGMSWFAEKVFGVDISSRENRNDFKTAIRTLMESSESFFRDAECLKGLDLDDAANAEEIYKRISAQPKSVEWWGYMAGGMASAALKFIEEGNASEAAWAMATSERFRALAVFKTNFEEAVFIGHSARRLVELLHIWDTNRSNKDEGFWQIKLSENAYAISQLFSVPVTLIQGKAYVGGMRLDGKDARFLDFVYSGGTSNDAILIEIKTPVAKLLASRYRKNVYPPSKDLAGTVVQINDYCRSLRENIHVARESGIDLNTFNPKRVIIIGNSSQLSDSKKKASFELFRSSLAGIDVITFDEFFKKIEQLAKLFNLVRTASASAPRAASPAP